MKKILLVEDDADLAALVTYNLEKEGYSVAQAQTGRGVSELCRRLNPDLMLLDVVLPETDGWDICKAIRADPDFHKLPIIFLTARGSESDRILGLELGGNDYITKPFSIRELLARIKVQFRITSEPRRILRGGDLALDRTGLTVHIGDRPIAVTATEFRLLEFLMSKPGMILRRSQLLDAVWGQGQAITDRAVDVYVFSDRSWRPTQRARNSSIRFEDLVILSTLVHPPPEALRALFH
jgi:two-component system, OmpR family, alkaline phosphatase synthesis response regulator PhoP